MDGRDQRKFKRIPTHLLANLKKTTTQESQITKEIIIKNISAGGVFIETMVPFSVGELVTFDLYLPGDRYKLKIVGVVRWKRIDSLPYGIGVQFVKVATEDKNKITKFIEQHQVAD
ncbi:MAG: PilZ domain-containing protein [Candidatus Hydrogenedentota bacterium]